MFIYIVQRCFWGKALASGEGGDAAVRPSPQRSVLFYCCSFIYLLIDLFTLRFPRPRLGLRRNEFLAEAVVAACEPKLPWDFLRGARGRGDRSNVVVVEVPVVEVVVAVG